MLRLENIAKIYKNNGINQKALDNININFREKEFVVILGPSGSGKTTLLNIIGGLDNNYVGNLVFNNCSTKTFTLNNWNYYRNKNIGFIFQNYNLIEHDNVIGNVLMPLLLNNKKDKKKAMKILKKLNLENCINKTPKQLSGGSNAKSCNSKGIN